MVRRELRTATGAAAALARRRRGWRQTMHFLGPRRLLVGDRNRKSGLSGHLARLAACCLILHASAQATATGHGTVAARAVVLLRPGRGNCDAAGQCSRHQRIKRPLHSQPNSFWLRSSAPGPIRYNPSEPQPRHSFSHKLGNRSASFASCPGPTAPNYEIRLGPW